MTIIVIAFFIIQKNTKFAKNDYPLNSSPRGENGKIVSGFKNILDLDTKEDKRRKLVNVLHNISQSDKVVLTEPKKPTIVIIASIFIFYLTTLLIVHLDLG